MKPLTALSIVLLASSAFAQEKAGKINDYGPPEHGHALTEAEVHGGRIALFDGQTDFGWSDARVQDGVLVSGRSHFAPRGGTLKVDVAKPGILRWHRDILLARTGIVEVTLSGAAGPVAFSLADGLQVRSLSYKPPALADLTPRTIGGDWVPLHHPKLPKDRRATWTLKDGVVSAIGGPGCLEYQKVVFGDFLLQLEVRTKVQHANGGVFFRTIPGSFMNGYEAQIYNRCLDNDPARPATWATGAIDDRQNARRLASRDGIWFHYTIAAQGPRLATWINGYQTADWLDTRPEDDNPRKGKRVQAGTLQLQAHDAATHVEFRKMRITEEK